MWEEIWSNFFGNIISAVVIFVIAFFFKNPVQKFLGKFLYGIRKEADEEAEYQTQFYKFGSKPNGIEQIETFKKDGFIGIGWPNIGDLKEYKEELESGDKSLSEITGEFKEFFNDENPQNRGRYAGYFKRLISIKHNDFIVVSPAGKNDLYIFRVKDGYLYKPEMSDKHVSHSISIDNNDGSYVHIKDYHHIDDFDYINDAFSDAKISSFKRAINSQNTIISLNKYSGIINELWKHNITTSTHSKNN